MHRSRYRYPLLMLLLFYIGAAAADPFAGEFSGSLDGQVYQLSISAFARGQYDGIYRAGGEVLPLNARRFGERLAGQIGVADAQFGFVAQIQGGGLLVQDEKGRTILFRRQAGASTPDGD